MVHQILFPGLGIDITISRVAFSIGNFSVYWYGIIIALGLCLAILYGTREAKKTGLSQDYLFNMILIAIPSAIICARFYYVIFSWDMYKDDLMSIFDIRNGGIAIYGGVIGSVISIYCYCKAKKINLGIPLDILAIGLLMGQSIGRWGNFVNAEAYGSATSLPWAMTIKEGAITVADRVHPTFLYESLWNAMGIIVLVFYKKIKMFKGELFCAYMVWYGLGRMWIEGLRSDSLYIGDFRISQILAVATLLLGMAFILIGRIRRNQQH